MNPLPSLTRDRWANRPEPKLGHGTVYWHMLMRTYTEVQSAAADAQEVLEKFPGFHMTPHEWLHITVLVAGSTEAITRDQMHAMLESAQQSLCSVAPIPVNFGKILYHPEAVMLAVTPVSALMPILHAARSATRMAAGNDNSTDSPSPWAPHVTVAYSTVEQPAKPIISTLGETFDDRKVVIDSVSLVIQWGPDRLWNWEQIGTVQLKA